jgi:hypothetical protein
MKTLRTTIAVFAAVSALALPASALASSGQEGYAGPNSVVAGIQGGGGGGPTSSAPAPAPVAESAAAPVSASEESGTLPFTGANLGILAGGGLLLLVLGFGLRKLTQQRPAL